LSYDDVVALSGLAKRGSIAEAVPAGDARRSFSVAYRYRISGKTSLPPPGTLAPGQVVRVRNRMIFTVAASPSA
jgi:hypothetical protein